MSKHGSTLDTETAWADEKIGAGCVPSDKAMPRRGANFVNKLDHANAATYTDNAGWKSTIVPKRVGVILDPKYPSAQGVKYVTAPSGETRRWQGFWMDWPELQGDGRRREYRAAKAAYYAMSTKERAAVEAKLQATAYAPLRWQFKAMIRVNKARRLLEELEILMTPKRPPAPSVRRPARTAGRKRA
jgi:hypothetical protein